MDTIAPVRRAWSHSGCDRRCSAANRRRDDVRARLLALTWATCIVSIARQGGQLYVARDRVRADDLGEGRSWRSSSPSLPRLITRSCTRPDSYRPMRRRRSPRSGSASSSATGDPDELKVLARLGLGSTASAITRMGEPADRSHRLLPARPTARPRPEARWAARRASTAGLPGKRSGASTGDSRWRTRPTPCRLGWRAARLGGRAAVRGAGPHAFRISSSRVTRPPCGTTSSSAGRAGSCRSSALAAA